MLLLEPRVFEDPRGMFFESYNRRTFARATGVDVAHIALRPEQDFHPSIDDLHAVITERTRALVITNPHNPTGVVLTRDELTALAELCREHNMWLLADEV